MARKTKEVLIDADNRDKGKVFVITEPSCNASERISGEFFFMLARAGAKVPKELRQSGMGGIALLFSKDSDLDLRELLAYLTYEEVEPLLSQLMSCVRYRHAPGHPLQELKQGDESQVEEVSTLVQLKMDTFELITGFSLAG